MHLVVGADHASARIGAHARGAERVVGGELEVARGELGAAEALAGRRVGAARRSRHQREHAARAGGEVDARTGFDAALDARDVVVVEPVGDERPAARPARTRPREVSSIMKPKLAR